MEHNKDSFYSGDGVYKNIIDNMFDGVMIIGFDGKIRLDNKNTARILELDADTLCNRSVASLMMENSKNDEFFQCIIDSVYTKERVSKTVAYHVSSGVKYLRLAMTFLRDSNEDAAVVAVISDVTELFELNKQNRILTEKLMDFVDDFVEVMIDAIEARSPYNANHTKNMVKYMMKYLDWLEENGDNSHSETRYPLVASVWLHDIGKLVIPLEIMDKPTRLGDKEDDVYHRIEVAKLCEEIRGLRTPEYSKEADEKIDRLEEIRELIESINGLGYINDKQKEEVKKLFDEKVLSPSGDYIDLLDEYEKESLSLDRGTLTEGERAIIQSHVEHTHSMLTKMQFSGSFETVPDWAGMHHEYLDGSGYPNHVTAEAIPWEVRILTIVDVYDALTAEDRPYKHPMPAEKAFNILRSMVDEGKLDGEVLESFYESKAWS